MLLVWANAASCAIPTLTTMMFTVYFANEIIQFSLRHVSFLSEKKIVSFRVSMYYFLFFHYLLRERVALHFFLIRLKLGYLFFFLLYTLISQDFRAERVKRK